LIFTGTSADVHINQLACWTTLKKLGGFGGKQVHPTMINYKEVNLSLNDCAMA
jgi:hypothetical protein